MFGPFRGKHRVGDALAILYNDRDPYRHHCNPAVRLGDKLVYLIRDFIKLLANWELEAAAKTSAAELYKFAWKECRSFVLPMNPQRSELEYAVCFCLKEFGISVRPPKKKKSPQRIAAV